MCFIQIIVHLTFNVQMIKIIYTERYFIIYDHNLIYISQILL